MLNQRSDSFLQGSFQASAEQRHYRKRDDYRVGRDFPRLAADGVSRRVYYQLFKIEESNKSWVRSYLPTFHGTSNISDLLEWINTVDRFFEEMHPPEKLECKMAYYALEGEAKHWWQQLQHRRLLDGESQITIWPRMKYLLITDFWRAICSTECLHQSFTNRLDGKATEDYVRKIENGKEELKHANCLTKFPLQRLSGKQLEKNMHDDFDVSYNNISISDTSGTQVTEDHVKQNEEATNHNSDNTHAFHLETLLDVSKEEEPRFHPVVMQVEETNVATKECLEKTNELTDESLALDGKNSNVDGTYDYQQNNVIISGENYVLAKSTREKTLDVAETKKVCPEMILGNSSDLKGIGGGLGEEAQSAHLSKIKVLSFKEVLGTKMDTNSQNNDLQEENDHELVERQHIPAFVSNILFHIRTLVMFHLSKVTTSNLTLKHKFHIAGPLSFTFDPGGNRQTDMRSVWMFICVLNTQSLNSGNIYVETCLGTIHLEMKPPISFSPTVDIGVASQNPMFSIHEDNWLTKDASSIQEALRIGIWEPREMNIHEKMLANYHLYLFKHSFKEYYSCCIACIRHHYDGRTRLLIRFSAVMTHLLIVSSSPRHIMSGECKVSYHSVAKIVSFSFNSGGVPCTSILMYSMNYLPLRLNISRHCTTPQSAVTTELMWLRRSITIQVNGDWNSHMILKVKFAKKNLLCWCLWFGNPLSSLVHFMRMNYRSCILSSIEMFTCFIVVAQSSMAVTFQDLLFSSGLNTNCWDLIAVVGGFMLLSLFELKFSSYSQRNEYLRKTTPWNGIGDIISTKQTSRETIMHRSCLGLGEGKAVNMMTLSNTVHIFGQYKCFKQKQVEHKWGRLIDDATGVLIVQLWHGVFVLQCNHRMIVGYNITRGRVILWEGWKDVNNLTEQFMETLKLFHHVVNGLDPPIDLDRACAASMRIPTSSLVDELSK